MARNSSYNSKQVSQHKRLASGAPVTGMKRGGTVFRGADDEAEDRRIVKRMVKSEALTGKKHGGAVKNHDMPMKRGGSATKCPRCGMKHGGRC